MKRAKCSPAEFPENTNNLFPSDSSGEEDLETAVTREGMVSPDYPGLGVKRNKRSWPFVHSSQCQNLHTSHHTLHGFRDANITGELRQQQQYKTFSNPNFKIQNLKISPNRAPRFTMVLSLFTQSEALQKIKMTIVVKNV